jgi:hypothetical protein
MGGREQQSRSGVFCFARASTGEKKWGGGKQAREGTAARALYFWARGPSRVVKTKRKEKKRKNERKWARARVTRREGMMDQRAQTIGV